MLVCPKAFWIGFLFVMTLATAPILIYNFAEVIQVEISINDLQAYLADRYGGWATEQSMFMKLVEEMGEVAEVLNKRAGRKASEEADLTEQLGTELADLIHYAVAIAAINDIDLSDTIVKKDRIASVKYRHSVNLESFLESKKAGE